MPFRQRYQCEYCDEDFMWLPHEVEEVCSACNDTGDSRSNKEKYGCKTCKHYERKNDSCKLVKPYLIEDINCPGREEK